MPARRGHPLRLREYIFVGTVDVALIRIWLRDPVP
jgi:hypothetical protein